MDSITAPIISGAVSGLISAGIAKVPIQILNDLFYGAVGWKIKAFATIGELRYQEKVLDFGKKVGLRIELIDPNNIKEPTFRIASSYIQAASNCITEEEISDLFARLVANTIDQSKEKYLHPAFGEILNQMSPLDARILRELFNSPEYGIQIRKLNSNVSYYLPGCYQWFGASWKDLDQSMRNLDRLGLISITDPVPMREILDSEEKFLKDPRIQLNLEKIMPGIDFQHEDPEPHPIQLTTLGFNFLKICVIAALMIKKETNALITKLITMHTINNVKPSILLTSFF